MKKKSNSSVVNPFSEKFSTIWELWKQFKSQQFRFTYRGTISEQAALNKLVRLSNGNEKVAEEIINQSIDNGWRGFFELKQNTNGTGKRNSIDSADSIGGVFNASEF